MPRFKITFSYSVREYTEVEELEVEASDYYDISETEILKALKREGTVFSEDEEVQIDNWEEVD